MVQYMYSKMWRERKREERESDAWNERVAYLAVTHAASSIMCTQVFSAVAVASCPPL